jgi:hypothetical protein
VIRELTMPTEVKSKIVWCNSPSGVASWEIDEIFTNLTNLTNRTGTCTAAGTLNPPNSGLFGITHNTQFGQTYRQYAKIQLAGDPTGTDTFEMDVRCDTSGNGYCCHFDLQNGTMRMCTLIGWELDSYIGLVVSGRTFATNNWIGIEVYNTGTNTVFNAWHWTSDPGEYADWGVPTLARTDNPAQTHDSETYCALSGYSVGATLVLDNLKANSSAT